MHAALCRKVQQEKKEEGIYNYKHVPVFKNFTESSCLYLGAGMWAGRQIGREADRQGCRHGDTSALMSFQETGLKGCPHSPICESDFFIATNGVCWIQCVFT